MVSHSDSEVESVLFVLLLIQLIEGFCQFFEFLLIELVPLILQKI